MRVCDPSITPTSRGSPASQTGEQRDDDELLRLADELSERDGIPIDVAYSIIQRHGLRSVKEARSNE